jgi:hypothetical protein
MFQENQSSTREAPDQVPPSNIDRGDYEALRYLDRILSINPGALSGLAPFQDDLTEEAIAFVGRKIKSVISYIRHEAQSVLKAQ